MKSMPKATPEEVKREVCFERYV